MTQKTRTECRLHRSFISMRFISFLFPSHSPRCSLSAPPPQALGRLLERVVDEMADDIHFVEVDITESPDVAQNAGITGTPTVQVKNEKDLSDECLF